MPKKIDPNLLGERGESIFNTKITKHFLLRPNFLGDKYESVDFMVDLVSARKRKAFFFVSVKTTKKAKYSKKSKRLRIKVKKKQLTLLKKFKIPTYIVGVDEEKEKAFIVCVKGIATKSISSIPTQFSISKKTTLETLCKEVKLYWDSVKADKTFKSKFKYK